MKTFKIETLGCKVNQCESEDISNFMIASGMEFSNDLYSADVVIINTCAVTQRASAQSRRLLKKVIRNNSDAKLIVTGCYSQFLPKEIAKMKGVDTVIDNEHKQKIVEKIQFGKIVKQHNSPEQVNYLRKKTRSMVKIQDGCNSFCSYCIIPYTRGKSRSVPEGILLSKIRFLGEIGYKEIILTGINAGNYGKDLSIRTNLYKLLSKIVNGKCIERIRVSSIEPKKLTDELIQLVKKTEKKRNRICPHFHIPIQSGDDFILKNMHRAYNVDYFVKLIEKILNVIPDCAIGTDIMVGFPGETEASFNKTYNLIKEMQISYLHVFPFSPRKGTLAWNYPEKVIPKEVKRRCLKMRELGILKRKQFHYKFLNKILPVLVERRRDKLDKRLQGFSENYIPVKFVGPDSICNTIQHLKVVRVTEDGGVIGSL